MENLEENDLEWLNSIIEKGKLLEVFDKRISDSHSKSERIEIYYYTGEVLDTELTVFIKFENDKIVGYETY
ncbi:MAG: hypothetical protein IJF92_00790 [Bacilli bacterium]|nr:hypothetical protein [Bacilli bacterium]MBQ3307649.1 hypothetical protein [Bacilli bacterium]